MGKQILKTDIKREPNKIYYCATADDGCLIVCEAIMMRGGRKKGSTKKKAKK